MSEFEGIAEVTGGGADSDAPPLGPCQPWADLADLPEGCPCRTLSSGDDETPSDATLEDLLAAATDILWSMLGRPPFGVCEVTVHPEQIDGICTAIPRNRFEGWGRTDDYIDQAVLLRAPVNDVIEVIIDGEVLSPSAYELHDGQWLIRKEGSWPLGGGAADEERFVVTYAFGVRVPYIVRAATVEIANYLWKHHCSNTGNRLSPAVNSISTQGVSTTFNRSNPASQKAVERAVGGEMLPATQLARASINPTGQPRQTEVYSPDLGYRNRTVRTFA